MKYLNTKRNHATIEECETKQSCDIDEVELDAMLFRNILY
jgi:hypothetical protein